VAEVELKLDVGAAAAAALDRSALLAGEARQATLHSTYFDTPEHALATAGVSLRIRRAGRSRIQSIKVNRDDSAGLFARDELERKVVDDTPVLDDDTPVPALLGARADALSPLFTVRYVRRSWDLDRVDGMIELAIDRGEVIAGNRRAPFDEVELELKQGDPAALFALAREIAAQAPARLGVISKAERGYRMLAGEGGAVKAEPVALDQRMPAAAALRRIANNCVRQFRLNETILLERRDIEATHQARVALRRLRTLFRVYCKMLSDDRFDHFQREARWLIGELGEARDVHVLIERAEPGPLRDRLGEALGVAEDRVSAALASARARAFPLELAQWLATGSWANDAGTADRRDQLVKQFAVKALNRLRRRVKRYGRDLEAIDAAERHRARKAAKKLRYAAEFFGPLFDNARKRRRCDRFIVALKRLQDELGALNDIAVTPMLLDKLGLIGEPGTSTLLGKSRHKRHLRAATDAYRDLIRAKRFWR